MWTSVGSLSSLFGDEAPILRETDFQLLLLATLIPVLGTALMSPILDTLIDPFGATSANIGLMISAFTAPAIVMIPVAGMLADRYGRKPVLVSALVLFGLGGTAIAFTTDFRVVLALRFLQGIAFAGTNPIIITSIGDLYTGEAEATGQGIRFMASGFSGALLPLVAGGVVLIAWQFPFLLYAIAFPIAIGIYLWFDEPTRESKAASDGDGTEPSYSRGLIRLATHPRILSVMVARSLMIAIWMGFLTYNSLVVVRLMGGTPVEAGILTTIGYFVFAGSASQAGRATAMLESRLVLLLAANVCLGVGFVGFLFAPGLGVAAVFVTTTAIGFGFLGALYRSIITGLAPEDFRAGVVSLSEAGGRLVATVTPLAMGGVIAFASPTVGLASALQAAGIGVALVSAGGSIVCLFVASAARPVTID